MRAAGPPVETISHYRLLERLGQGAMGEVWLAEDTQLPRKVAIKLLLRHLSQDQDSVDRLLREAQAAASVDHPAVVTVYEAGMAADRPFLVMQRVEGETLERRLARGALPTSEAIELVLRMADGLAEVHALGIVHRDLKPSNVVLTAHGPKILDFGLASLKNSVAVTSPGMVLGTPRWMSPEQARGMAADNRSDLWALGAMLYQLLTGKPPFNGETFEAVVSQVLHHLPPPPSTLCSDVGPDLDYIVLKLLRKDPAHRYARAEDMIADLTNCQFCETNPEPEAGPATPRLAVLSFEVMSAEADDAFLASGLADDLVVDLTRLGGLQVASRGETLPYRDRAVPPRTVARELGVDYVLLGSVRRAGNRARINVQLVRAADGHALWAERFDRTLDDLFEVQAEVSKRIVEALQVQLRPGEKEMLDRAPTRSREAYGLYLKARELMPDRTRESLMAVEELLKRAIELDPRFALAHAALGECYARRGLAWYAGLESGDQALPHARRALELEPDLLEGHLVLAMVHRLRGEPELLLKAIERVVALSPDHEEALEWAAWSYMALGKPEAALGILERLVERRSESTYPTLWLSACNEMLGRKEEALRAERIHYERILEALQRRPDNVYVRSLLASTLIRSGEREAGLAQVARCIDLAPNDGRIRYNAACSYARAGMSEQAIEQLKEGIRNIPSYLADWPRHDPDLVSLHDHPEFIRLFGRVE
jgi:TolB-like protein/tRNA A-37 threonylcarbamoyl transferase component Bud32/thioredoxin-like negative regulator of GroEL